MSSSSHSLNELARATFLHALKSVSPEALVSSILSLDDSNKVLKIQNKFGDASIIRTFDLTATPSVLIVGAGKATQEIVSGLLAVLAKAKVPELSVQVLANYPKGQKKIDICKPTFLGRYELMEASHPISDESTIDSTNIQVNAMKEAPPNTLVIAVMSGGGSALFETTHSTTSTTHENTLNNSQDIISLEDIQNANKVLIESGANISEINTIRKHFSQVKGGRLAQHALESSNVTSVIGLYLSDVVGNDLSSVASGPTCPDKTTFADCAAILAKYGIAGKLPSSIQNHLNKGISQALKGDYSLETPKPGNPLFEKVFNVLIGSADTSALAAQEYLKSHGLEHVHIFSSSIDGEASLYGQQLPQLVDQLVDTSNDSSKVAFVGTGEFTVTIKGKGVGGRNQEMLLSSLHQLSQQNTTPGILSKSKFAILSCAFDGIEGNSPATGAVIDDTSLSRLSIITGKEQEQLTQQLKQVSDNNDSFSIFSQLQDAIITGYTGTNVNDLTMILLDKKL